MKKVLILTVTAGNGHNSAAYAMKAKLEKTGGFECKVVDIYKEYARKIDAWVQEKGYVLSVSYFRYVFNWFCKRYMKDYFPCEDCTVQNFVKFVHGGLLKLIYDFQPDVIYCTNFACGTVLANLKRVFKLPSVNVACMLDYVVTPFWETSIGGIDFLTMPNEDFRGELLKKGFKSGQLLSTGIPVSEKFSFEIDKVQAREKLGLRQNLFTVMILYGGGDFGETYGLFKSLISGLEEEIQIVVINGHDETSKKKIDNLIKHDKIPENLIIKNVGFSKQVDLFMSASDCLIGKGGGLSTTEAINKALPLIATTKLPTQEIYNVDYLKNKGAALSFKNNKELLKQVKFLYHNPETLKKMSEILRSLKTNGIEEIFQLIEKQPKAEYREIDTKVDFGKVNKLVKKARKKEFKALKKTV